MPYNLIMSNVNLSFLFRNVIKLKQMKYFGVRYKSFNSNDWLERRRSDIYVERAKKENYRCRSAFKLIEIIDRFELIKPGFKVLDVGAAPGSWSQVLADRTNSNGKDSKRPRGLVIAIDLNYIFDIEGVTILNNMDFTQESSQMKILDILGHAKLDFVFSDMAPKATGVKCLDQENILQLIYPVLYFAVRNLKQNGGCLIKLWAGNHDQFKEQMKRFFKHTKVVKPDASYDSSSEMYLLGRGFVGVK